MSSGPARPRGSRGPWIAILAAALLVRVAIVFVVPNVIQFSDSQQFVDVGRTLAEHGTYGDQTLRPPGYPTVIAAVYRVFGESLRTLRLVEAVIGTVAVGLLGALGVRLFGRAAGLFAAVLAAFHPVLAFLPSTQYSENVAVLLTVLGLAAAFAALRHRDPWRWLLAGVVFGLAALVRPNLVMLLPGLAVGAALVQTREHRGFVAPLIATSLGLVLAIAPWAVRNHHVHGRWYFISTGGGRQFWYGNNAGTDGSTTLLPEPDKAMKYELEHMPYDEFAFERLYYQKGSEFVRANPGRAAYLYLRHLGNLFALWPDTLSQKYINLWSRVTQGGMSVIVFLGALISLSRWRREPALWPLAGAVVSFALVNAVFFASMRYRMAFEPCLLLMAGLGWAVAFRVAQPPREVRS